jgi:hypothetical protein
LGRAVNHEQSEFARIGEKHLSGNFPVATYDAHIHHSAGGFVTPANHYVRAYDPDANICPKHWANRSAFGMPGQKLVEFF